MIRSRGFTLVEMMVALVVLSIVGTAAFRMLNVQRRASDAQTEQTILQSSIRNGTLIARSELQGIAVSTGSSDLVAVSDTAVTYRAMRTLSAACLVSATEVRIRVDLTFGTRPIQAGRDAMYLFVENDPTISSDNEWITLPINTVTNGSSCGPDPAIALGTIDITTLTPLSDIELDAPVRTFEVMEMLMFTQAGENWLGLHSVSAGDAPEPVVGPLAPGGMTLTYLDAAGNSTLLPLQVRTIQLTLRGISDRVVHTGQTTSQVAALQDSLTSVIQLRNSP